MKTSTVKVVETKLLCKQCLLVKEQFLDYGPNHSKDYITNLGYELYSETKSKY